MQPWLPKLSPHPLLAALAVALLSLPAWADDQNNGKPKPPDIKFETADKVELKGVFYPGSKNKPTVILVHNFKQDRQKGGWDRLIDALQKNDIAVLTFDLRGHGDSTTIADPDVFWKDNMNRSYIRGARANKDSISYKDFNPGYYPMFVNDLVAAKNYLDKQNDAGACNSSDVFVVAAGDSAAIAAMWMAYAWEQYPLIPNAFGRLVPDWTAKPMGQDIAGAVMLSAPTAWGRIRVAGPLMAPLPGRPGVAAIVPRNKLPVAFVYGAQDTKAANAANALLRRLKEGKGVPRETGKREIGRSKAVGAALLENQAAHEFVSKFIDTVMDRRGASVWTEKKPPAPLLINPGTLNQLASR
jgi:pimeloyl-ACP methyl ester carboxylesterase